jgi:hypothetical protein
MDHLIAPKLEEVFIRNWSIKCSGAMSSLVARSGCVVKRLDMSGSFSWDSPDVMETLREHSTLAHVSLNHYYLSNTTLSPAAFITTAKLLTRNRRSQEESILPNLQKLEMKVSPRVRKGSKGWSDEKISRKVLDVIAAMISSRAQDSRTTGLDSHLTLADITLSSLGESKDVTITLDNYHSVCAIQRVCPYIVITE